MLIGCPNIRCPTGPPGPPGYPGQDGIDPNGQLFRPSYQSFLYQFSQGYEGGTEWLENRV